MFPYYLLVVVKKKKNFLLSFWNFCDVALVSWPRSTLCTTLYSLIANNRIPRTKLCVRVNTPIQKVGHKMNNWCSLPILRSSTS